MNAERILFYAIFFMVILCFFLLMIIFSIRAKLKMVECKCNALEKEKNEYAKHLARLMNAVDVASENRREADAKVEALHSGDAVDNALDCLRDGKK